MKDLWNFIKGAMLGWVLTWFAYLIIIGINCFIGGMRLVDEPVMKDSISFMSELIHNPDNVYFEFSFLEPWKIMWDGMVGTINIWPEVLAVFLLVNIAFYIERRLTGAG